MLELPASFRRCCLMSLRLEASPELLKLAYDAGLHSSLKSFISSQLI